MRDSGFTIIEIIMAIALSAILAVILMQIMGGYAERSYQSVAEVNRSLALRQVMEKMAADHRKLLLSDETPLLTLQQRINSNDYWQSDSFGLDIGTDHECLEFVYNVSSDTWVESNQHDQCLEDDTILKVTITFDHQSLTALFTQ